MIRLFDNVLTPDRQQQILTFLRGGSWNYGAYSDAAPNASRYLYRHFAGHFADGEGPKDGEIAAELEAFPLVDQMWKDLRSAHLPDHTLKRCYANAYPAGAEGGLHRDSLEPNHFTAIYYPHLAWHPNYAGETVFFNDDGTEIIASIYPKPNRLVVFDGKIPHVARGVSRQCPELRITLMFKTAAVG